LRDIDISTIIVNIITAERELSKMEKVKITAEQIYEILRQLSKNEQLKFYEILKEMGEIGK
jgi:hypothetical protein